MLVTIFILYTSVYIHVLNAYKVRRKLKDTFDFRPSVRPVRPIKLALRARPAFGLLKLGALDPGGTL